MIRQELVQPTKPELEYSFIGAIAIHQELNNRGIKPLPALSTINLILNKRGLTLKKPKSNKQKSTIYYPTLQAQYPNHRHELDLVTPRYISGYGKVVAVNRIDVSTTQVYLQVYQAKGADNILEFLTNDWKKFGIPIYLQLDNEASFRGGMYHARSIGKIIRFCLNFGVQIIFIPWKEPWRNPFIENFNGHFNRVFWQKKRFKDIDHMRQEAKRFLEKHNRYQIYKQDRFSKAKEQSHTKRFLPPEFYYNPDLELPITKGKIHFVRLVQEDGSISVLNENLTVKKNLSFEYVWVTINTAKQTLEIFHQADKDQKRVLVKERKYELREAVVNQIPAHELLKL